MPPSYWFDTTHSSNNSNDDDSTQTNVGGSFGFDSEQGSGDTVPTMDSIQRFLSPADQAALWQQPDAHQYHLNYESTDGEHSGYSFGTLDNLDTAVAARYGKWTSLAQYVQEAQVQNYENTRSQFEAYIDHWNNYPTPSTGTDYWQLNKGWPTMLWDLYNYDYDTAGAYFGAKKANEELHVLYALDTGKVTVDNLSGAAQHGLSVQARVYDTSGRVLDSQTAGGLSLAPQAVSNGVLTPKVPAATTPPTPATTYFVELTISQHGSVVDRNVYWLSTQQDVIDWDSTEGNPQADNGDPLSQYADLTALQQLPSEPVQVAAATQPAGGGKVTTSVTITNPASNKAVAFFLRADVRRGSASGSVASGDNQVLPDHLDRQRRHLVARPVADADRDLRQLAADGCHPGGQRRGLERARLGLGRPADQCRPGGRDRRGERPRRDPLRGRRRRGLGERQPRRRRGPAGVRDHPHVRRQQARARLDRHVGRELADRQPVDQLHPGRHRRHLHHHGPQHRVVGDRRIGTGHPHRRG